MTTCSFCKGALILGAIALACSSESEPSDGSGVGVNDAQPPGSGSMSSLPAGQSAGPMSVAPGANGGGGALAPMTGSNTAGNGTGNMVSPDASQPDSSAAMSEPENQDNPGPGDSSMSGGGGTPATGSTDSSSMGGGGGNPATGSGGDSSLGAGGVPAAGGATGEQGPDGASGDVVPSAGCGAATWPESGDDYTIDVNGTQRDYILRIPDDYDPERPYRLIFAFHWLGGTAQQVASGGGVTKGPYYGLWDLAEGSAIFVAPQGLDNSWPNGNVPFAEALLDRLTSEFCIDESRVFSNGFSMGGSMSYAVACGLGSRVRAVAVYSGGPMSGCAAHDEPVAYFMSHGTEDSVCTYPGFGVPQVNDFAEVNGCTPREMPTPSGNEPSCVDFDGCSEGYPTRACIFVGDHTPSPPNTQNTWVPQEAWNFLSQF